MQTLNCAKGWPFRITELGAQGYGIVATREIRQGELILKEPEWLRIKGRVHEEFYELSLPSFREQYAGLNRPGEQAEFLSLTHASMPMGEDSEQEEEQLLARVDCNAFAVTDADSALFRLASRFNHSCIPNVDYEILEDNLPTPVSFCARTNQVIAVGAQLFINYIKHEDLAAPEHRQRELQDRYGFLCNCRKCEP